MNGLLLILFLLSLVALVVSLIKPSILKRPLKKDLSRGKIALLFSVSTIIFFVLFGITSDTTSLKQTKDESTQKQEQIAENQAVKGEQSRVASPPSPPQKDTQERKDEAEVGEVEGVKVTKVIDGDTIEIEGGQRVRYIGIDTPETVHPSNIVDCYGKEASNKNRELVEEKIVRLEKDVSETDKYNRLLRYVYVSDIFVNDYLVREGYALSSSYPPDIKYQDKLKEAEAEARGNNRGLWGICKQSSQPAQPPSITQSPTTSMGANCDRSYPTVCIPLSPPDLDCADIIYRRFKVLSPDPHRFDSNHDGVGCESL